MENSIRTIYTLCGIPGSGKSYYGTKLKDQYNAVYLSSDEIRENIYGNADIQTNPAKVFMMMDSMTFEALENSSIQQTCTPLELKVHLTHINVKRWQ